MRLGGRAKKPLPGRLRVSRHMGSATDSRRRLRLERNEHAAHRASCVGLPQPLEGDCLLWALSSLELLPQQVVSLQRAGKYQKPAWRLSQGQKGLEKRGIMASQ